MKRAALLACITVLGCHGDLRFEDAPSAEIAEIEAGPAPCSSDDGCPTGLHCDVVSGQCVTCTNDDQCAGAGLKRCDVALNVCVECGSDLDCDTNQVCDHIARQCMIRCASGPTEHACPPDTPTCDELRQVCIRCVADSECNGRTDDGPYCDTTRGRCVHCTSSTQCPVSAPRCERMHGRCVGCIGPRDCAPGHWCDPRTLTCT